MRPATSPVSAISELPIECSTNFDVTVAHISDSNTLIVIDLASSRIAQPMLRQAGHRAIASAVSHAARTNGPRPRVLLHGDDPDLPRLEGVEFLSTLDYAVTPVGAADEPWIREVVERVRAYRRQHPDALMTFDTPEAALAALDALDD